MTETEDRPERGPDQRYAVVAGAVGQAPAGGAGKGTHEAVNAST
jgi:hypothetical protein